MPSIAYKPTDKQMEAEQLMAGPQRNTLLVGGSRSGKTFECVRQVAFRALVSRESRHTVLRQHLIDVRQSIGLDTLPKVMRMCYPDASYEYNKSDQYIWFPDKTVPRRSVYSEGYGVWLAGLDDNERVEKVLGKEHNTLYFNECSQIPYTSVLIAQTRLAKRTEYTAADGNRYLMRNRAIYDLNPVGTAHWTYRLFLERRDPVDLGPLVETNDYKFLFMNPLDNKENLDPDYIKTLMGMPLRMRRRFFEGQYAAEMEGALWTYEMIERARLHTPDDAMAHSIEDLRAMAPDLPPMRRIVVALDPSGASGPNDITKDAIGIVAAGLGADDVAYVFEDLTALYSPEQWGRIACEAFWRWKGDRVLGEANFGGDMVRAVVQATLDPVTGRPVGARVPFSMVTASRGKTVRAEPVAAMYERNKVRHVGRFGLLEEELTNFTTAGYLGERSPNRADALVWALTELFGQSLNYGLNEYYAELTRSLNAQKQVAGVPLIAKAAKADANEGAKMKPSLADVAKAAEFGKVAKTPAEGKNATKSCPECGAVCIAPVASGGWRCGICAAQWGGSGSRLGEPVTRRTYTR